MPVKTTIQTRRDTAANWTATNPVLAAGEMGLETDTRKTKFGDGTTAWASLAYATSAGLTVSDTAPSSPSAGAQWFNSSTGKTYIYYTDANSSQWIELDSNGTSATSTGNAIINGAFDIWARGTTAKTASTARDYLADRWFAQQGAAGSGAFTHGQAVDAPAGANAGVNSLIATVTTADASTAAGEQYWVGQIIEGYNFEQFQFGTASAQTVTVSFWVKSSITGTFGFCFRNSAADRSYVSTYSISATNTWEKKTITIAGDTSGTWLKDSGIGVRCEWTLSAGTDYQTGTANAWTSSNDMTTASQTNLLGTLGATWQITGVQLESGSSASSFKRNAPSIQAELAACQRYYWRISGANPRIANGGAYSTTSAGFVVNHPVEMRTAVYAIDYSGLGQSSGQISVNNIGATFATSALVIASSAEASTRTTTLVATCTGLTNNAAYILGGNGGTSYLGFSAEL